MRNIIETAEQGSNILKDHPRANLVLSEVDQFYELFKGHAKEKGTTEAMLKVMAAAFDMGVAVGYRNAKKWQSE